MIIPTEKGRKNINNFVSCARDEIRRWEQVRTEERSAEAQLRLPYKNSDIPGLSRE